MSSSSMFFADDAVQQTVEIVENVPLAERTLRVRFRSPEIAARILPGQFVMLRMSQLDDPLIGRAFALYDTQDDLDGTPSTVDIVYLVHGKLTSLLKDARPGQRLDVWGPLGNGFPVLKTGHLIMVAGGIGQTPFLALAREYLGQRAYGSPGRSIPSDAGRTDDGLQVTLVYGTRRAALLAGVEDFESVGVDVKTATEDGSAGMKGQVTQLLEDVLQSDQRRHRHVVCCGPEPMMEAVAEIAARYHVPALVSLESPMACGIGICFSCVAKIKDADGLVDYRRTCVEGPVFRAEDVVW